MPHTPPETHHPKNGGSTYEAHFLAFGLADASVTKADMAGIIMGDTTLKVTKGSVVHFTTSKAADPRKFWGLRFDVDPDAKDKTYTLIISDGRQKISTTEITIPAPKSRTSKPRPKDGPGFTMTYPPIGGQVPVEFLAYGDATNSTDAVTGSFTDAGPGAQAEQDGSVNNEEWGMYCYVGNPPPDGEFSLEATQDTTTQTAYGLTLSQ